MSAAFWNQFPALFAMAMATPLGIVALSLCLLAGLLGVFLLKKPSAPTTFVIVLLIFGAAALTAAAFQLSWAQLGR